MGRDDGNFGAGCNPPHTSEADDFLLWAQGLVYIKTEENQKALNYFRKAVELNPDNDQAWVSLGMMHKLMGDEALSIANLEKAIDVNPYNAAALKQLTSFTLKNSDKFASTFAHLEFYLSEFCFDDEINLCNVQLLCQTKNWELAQLEVEKLILHEPESLSYINIKNSMIEAQMV